MKCDERHPICVNCDTSDRTCQYVARAAVSAHSPSSLSPSATSPDSVSDSASPEAALLQSAHHNQCFSFQHLLLLHHVEADMEDWLYVPESIRNLGRAYLGVALTSPFLMDQLLAVSAQHLSTIYTDLRDQYYHLGTALQARALNGFNAPTARPDIKARFLFSSLLALSTMAATAMSSRHNANESLPRFVEFLDINRGVRIIGDSAWVELEQSELGWIFTSFGNLYDYTEPLPISLFGIVQMLQRPDIDAATEEICSHAARCLGFIRKQLDSPTSWGVHVVMAWPSLVDPQYRKLLVESRPEAMVILAHFAVLLHQHREFWVFGDLGKNLIGSISRRIEVRWHAYLTKPLEILSASTIDKVA
ncbi:hypothetical protein NPX13_g4598 [Xylaria arbuscula]|uniref:Zn(2)-C6 fungal-type domain-containing protein n=1 Tax=Xylaria arbuscula TaxID=114810 RepID=A0A9W8TNG5_9PEZI|nr:hypothetical protein NPX13_g4598 [Xylaria arbuscula]